MSYDDVTPGPGARDSILNTGPYRITPVSARAITASRALVSMGGRLMGWSVRETSGSAGCVVELYDGTSSAGQLIVPVGVGNGTYIGAWFGDVGLDIEQGIFANVVVGVMDIVVYYRFDSGEY